MLNSPASKRQRAGRMPRIAILVDTSTTWGRRIVAGVNNYVRKNRPWQIFIEARGVEERINLPQGWHGEGVIARVGSVAMADALYEHGIPVVNVSGIQLSHDRFPRVTTDMQKTGELAAEHFLNRGFRNFGYFSLLGLSYVSAQQDAFIRATKRAGCRCAIYGVQTHEGAEPDWNLDLNKLAKWLTDLPKPTGILTWNADSGRQIIYASHLAGLHVPEEIALLSGTDDDLLCEVSQVPISAIHVAAEQIGYRAAELLEGLMRRGTVPKVPCLFPPLGIVTRQSTDTLAIRDKALVAALLFIRDSAAKFIQVTDVSRHAGVSRRVLERRFMEVLKRTVAEEIRRVHLEHAKKLLIETELSIPDVAEGAGFGSPEYLAYIFRAELNDTPLKFRKRARGR